MNNSGKEHILEAARRVIARMGVKDASMQAIAEEAGMTKGGLYYHYKGKDYILFELADRFLRETAAPVKRSLFTGEEDREKLLEVLLQGIKKRLNNPEHNLLQFYLTHEAVLGKNEELYELVVNKFRRWIATAENAIDQMYGQPGIEVKRALAASMIAMIDGQAIQLILSEELVDKEDFFACWEAFFRCGLPAMLEYLKEKNK
ncbi:transcriptional regulator, TetR family [Thermosyntropha lipolytica DSM 11003]|uniref:Transcriptional regulator, TetR family n=1 Tax=Thermosyntropha lipolytica DSM 11003 TaxID=1123382 RepID=A0A1M5LQF2_9FIRM|nr:TetR/AcrR family transcriptional regulator [Thermosyntropha lipolytica]SHG66573.1 transcriptional regulator, TetR family [Thermosyntropha lipolytica DSM 11003]